MKTTDKKTAIRILLVEDNEHDRIALRRAFKVSSIACHITECVRAEDALKNLSASHPPFDIGITDHGLPGMNGLEFCRKVLEKHISLPFVILTGKGSEALAVEALKAGVDDYIIKDPGQQYLSLLPVVVLGVLKKNADRLARKLAEEALQKSHYELEKRNKERTAKLAKATEQLKLELSERMRTEAALRLSEERFRSVAQSAGDAIITANKNGEIVFWNNAAEKIFGYSREHAVRQKLAIIMPERFRQSHETGLRRLVSSNAFRILGKTVEMVGQHKDGQEMPIELSLARWKSKEGVFFTGIVRDITKRKRAEQEIRHLSRQLIIVSEEEKKRLARDLHDEIGQVLTGLHFGIEALRGSIPAELEDQRHGCEDLIELVQKLGDSIRRVSSELRPDMLDHLGLVPTLEWFIEDFVKRIGGIDVDFQSTGMKKRPLPETEIVIYRVLQESLNNIAKHARASHVSVLLAYSHPKYMLTIKDNGIGFAPPSERPDGKDKKGIGLLGMRERVGSIGGQLEIRSNRAKGTMIRIELPVDQENAEA